MARFPENAGHRRRSAMPSRLVLHCGAGVRKLGGAFRPVSRRGHHPGKAGRARIATGERPPRPAFQSLLWAIVYQQLAGSAARAIHQRVLALLPDPETPEPETLLELDADALRGAGLSRNKLTAVQDLARKTLDGTVPDREALAAMTDEEIVRRLTAVRGIGRWTVEMLLIFDLGRPDVLPLDDLGVRKGFQAVHGMTELPSKRSLAAHGEHWRPYRSVASWYLWRAAEQPELAAAEASAGNPESVDQRRSTRKRTGKAAK